VEYRKLLFLYTHCYIMWTFTGWLANSCLFRHTWEAMALMVQLQMSSSWPPSKHRLIQQPPSAMITGDTLAGFPCSWLGLACLDLSVDPKYQISSTCKSTQICITNNARIIYTAMHIFTSKLNPGRPVDLARWLRIILLGTNRSV
jgi:hypothetical protein